MVVASPCPFLPRASGSIIQRNQRGHTNFPFAHPPSRFIVGKSTQRSAPTFASPSATPQSIDRRKIEISLPQRLSSSSWPYWMPTMGELGSLESPQCLYAIVDVHQGGLQASCVSD